MSLLFNKPVKKYPYDLNEEDLITLEKIRKENPNIPFDFILEFFVTIKKWTPEQHELYQKGDHEGLLKTFNTEGQNILNQIESFDKMSENLRKCEVLKFESEEESDAYFQKIIMEREKKKLEGLPDLESKIIEIPHLESKMGKIPEYEEEEEKKLSNDIVHII